VLDQSSKEKEYQKIILMRFHSVLNNSLVVSQKYIFMKEYFTFCILHLKQQRCIDNKGSPQNFAGLVAHLFWDEPTNFIFAHMLQSGVLHEIAEKKININTKLETFLLIFAHFFGITPLPPRYSIEKKREMKSPSVIVLPQLPSEVEIVVNEYNQKTKELFFSCMKKKEKESNQLPFSKKEVHSSDKLETKNDQFLQHLEKFKFQTEVISKYFAIAGRDDNYKNKDDLANTIRLDILFEKKMIPIPRFQSSRINAYALDFFKHGQIVVLMKDNRIHAGEIYALLHDFSLLLKTIAVSVSRCYPPEDPLVVVLNLLAKDFNQKFKEADFSVNVDDEKIKKKVDETKNLKEESEGESEDENEEEEEKKEEKEEDE